MKASRQFPRYIILFGLPACFVFASAFVNEAFGEEAYLITLGLVTTILSSMTVWANLAKRRWPIASGVVTRVHVQTMPGLFGWRDTEQDRTHIAYRYEVEGRMYQGEYSCHPTEDRVWRRLGGYPHEGSTVAVHYNRRHPSASSLAPGPSSLTIWFLLLGLAAIGAGGYFASR